MNKHQKNSATSRRWGIIAMLAIAIALGGAFTGTASAKKIKKPAKPTAPQPPQSQPTTAVLIPLVHKITACSTTISSSGFYQVQGSLNDNSGGTKDCIVISASNVTLDIINKNKGNPCNSTTINGNGSTHEGIHILGSASKVFIQGQNSNITGWQYGIEDDGNSATGEDFNVVGNSTAGLYMFGPTGSSFSNFLAGTLPGCFSQSSSDGALVVNAVGSQIFNAVASGNYTAGIDEQGTKNSKFSLIAAVGNSGNGFQLRGGNDNQYYDNLAGFPPAFPANGDDGFLVVLSEAGSQLTDNTAEGNGLKDIDIGADTCSVNTYWFNFFADPSNACVNNP